MMSMRRRHAMRAVAPLMSPDGSSSAMSAPMIRQPPERCSMMSATSRNAVKVFYEPRVLVAKLAATGWQAEVHPVGWRFFYANARRRSANSSA
jgi:hypothetical protein